MRIVLAEDQFLLRDGLIRLLDSHRIEVAAAVDNGSDILPAVDRVQPDLALLDVRLPPTFTDEGLQAALALHRRRPAVPVVLLSQYVEPLYLQELLTGRGHGVGYLLKDRVFDDRQFVAALRSVRDGGTVVDPEIVQSALTRTRRDDALRRLTPRELEVLQLMAQGRSNTGIAEELVVTEKAVAKHINGILAKLDLPPSTDTARRVAAVLTYLGV